MTTALQQRELEVLEHFIKSMNMLTDDEVQLIIDNTQLRSYKKGDIILREGQVSRECYFLLQGCIREYYIVDGEEKSTAFYTEGQPVTSFTSYSRQKPSKHFMVCAEDCIVTVGTDELEKEMCQMIPRLESVIRQEVEKATGEVQDDLAKFITSSPEERYKDLLDNRPELLNRIPQHQIASYIGVTPESLSRIRKRMLNAK
ncbi:MAG: Crp/Fnr family transcriptional regulator [Chitinophagaceae bacterium]|nr:Crp/Fnr family transcriptional regulator [Chitinophagaceae bacterium]